MPDQTLTADQISALRAAVEVLQQAAPGGWKTHEYDRLYVEAHREDGRLAGCGWRLTSPVIPHYRLEALATLLNAAPALLVLAEDAARLREALEAAGSDLIGFEGYFERLGSMGAVASIRDTLDKIDDALGLERVKAPSAERGARTPTE